MRNQIYCETNAERFHWKQIVDFLSLMDDSNAMQQWDNACLVVEKNFLSAFPFKKSINWRIQSYIGMFICDGDANQVQEFRLNSSIVLQR